MNIYPKFKILTVLLVLSVISILGLGQQIPDQHLKKNVMPVQNALATIKQLHPKKFEYTTAKYHQLKLPAGTQYGFMAEDVQQILPELVRAESKTVTVGKNNHQLVSYKTTDMESMIPLLVAAIQEQQKQINALKQQLEAQRN